MLIRNGKQEGWLTLSPSAIPLFAKSNNIEANGVQVVRTAEKGLALVAVRNLESQKKPVVTISRDLILSKENVWIYAKSDHRLQQVLDACGEFAQTTRHSILIFLLIQATYSCPHVSVGRGVQHAFADYIKFLPLEPLPTFWSDEELLLADGTSLKPATEAKVNSLRREYEQLQQATRVVPWCQQLWWDDVEGLLDLDDWKQVDAMYRSRALEFPGIGDCMAPYIDFANHASGPATVASYHADDEGNGLLLLHQNESLSAGKEVTITYGDEKGACEMVFSYGFLENSMTDALTLFLDISIPDDDPLKRAKQAFATCAPGVRLATKEGKTSWESEYLWLLVINEEDGLEFSVVETTSGERELRVKWLGEEIQDSSQIEARLQSHPWWLVFQLRAVAVLESRVEQQLETMSTAERHHDTILLQNQDIGTSAKELTARLHSLEKKLLQSYVEQLYEEKIKLASSNIVRDYLQLQQEDDEIQEDFS